MDINQALSQSIVTKTPTESPQSIEAPEPADEMLISYFGLNPNDLSANKRDQLADISEYLKTKFDKELDRLTYLKDLRFKLGSPDIEQTPLSQIHRYIKIMRQSEALVAKARAMEI